jgi:spore maturation protein CgeB
MKILYVGPLNTGGTCHARLVALRSLDLDIHVFDRLENLSWSGVGAAARFYEIATLSGPVLGRANRMLIEYAAKLKPSVVWIDKGDWILPDTLRTLRVGGSILCHHNTDAFNPRKLGLWVGRRLLRTTVKLYDIHLTTNYSDHARLESSHGQCALFTQLGYDDVRFDASQLEPEKKSFWTSDLVFIGHHEKNTELGILRLVEAGINVLVYGSSSGWFRSDLRAKLGDRLRPALNNDDYVCALKGAKIGLGFFSIINGNQTSGRSFEIPACGTLLLGMRSAQHLECFAEGKEAEFFSDFEELVIKARLYLADNEKRLYIAQAGRMRCLSSGYSWRAIMAADWNRVERLVADLRSR